MNQRITRRRGKCVFLCDLSCDLDWQLAIETSETAPSRAPPVYPVHGRSPNKQWLCAGVFFLPSPSLSPILTRQPLPWNHFLTRSNSRSVSTSTPALQFSFAVTWDLTWDQAQFARFGFFSVPCPPECYLQSENENRAWSQVSFVGLDLRSGNTLTINELEKWCFEIIRT